METGKTKDRQAHCKTPPSTLMHQFCNKAKFTAKNEWVVGTVDHPEKMIFQQVQSLNFLYRILGGGSS